MKVDSLALQRYGNQDLGSLLQKTSLVNISSNGAFGALSSVSMRGTSSTHTSVNWNGIAVNSLTTGSSDLSLINVGSFDDVEIVYGASGSLYGSGTLGGAINLSNTPHWRDQISIGYLMESGSFSNVKQRFQGRYSNSWLSYSGQAFYHYGKNDFTYTDFHDIGSPEERCIHNENKTYGMIHDLSFNLSGNIVDIGFWTGLKDKNIPGKMGFGEPVSKQNQEDSFLRTFVGWKTVKGPFRIELKTAYMYDNLVYTDGYTSEITAKRWINEFNNRWYLSNQWSLDLSVKYNQLVGITDNYESNAIEHEGILALATKYAPKIGEYIISGAKNWHTKGDPPPIIAFSSLTHLVDNILDFRLKAGTHYRRPTFNERHWKQGGNVDLLSEEGHNVEVGLVYNQNTLRGDLKVDINLYQAKNKNSIAWKPVGGLSEAVNTGKMLTQGAELEIRHSIALQKSTIQSGLMYGYNDAYNDDRESEDFKKTLAYRPRHLAKLSGDFIRDHWNTGVNVSYRSATKTWEEKEIKEFMLVDLHLAYRFDFSHFQLSLNSRIENLLDKSYEVISAYPMPGRAFYFSANIIFNK